MFTGIVEELGKVVSVKKEGLNVHFVIEASFSPQLKVDQSVSHNGVCLTVVAKDDSTYSVTAIAETLQRTNLGELKVGDIVNLERSMKAGDRLDGHIVQGHVDQCATLASSTDQKGSWLMVFTNDGPSGLIVSKGSICVNGISLTVVDCDEKGFSVAIIPHTYKHTNLHLLKPGNKVNVEFDVVGKYVAAMGR